MDRITQAQKSPNPSLLSVMCVFVLGATNQEIMTGPLHIIFGAEWRRQHLTCGLEVGGRRWEVGGGRDRGVG